MGQVLSTDKLNELFEHCLALSKKRASKHTNKHTSEHNEQGTSQEKEEDFGKDLKA